MLSYANILNKGLKNQNNHGDHISGASILNKCLQLQNHQGDHITSTTTSNIGLKLQNNQGDQVPSAAILNKCQQLQNHLIDNITSSTILNKGVQMQNPQGDYVSSAAIINKGLQLQNHQGGHVLPQQVSHFNTKRATGGRTQLNTQLQQWQKCQDEQKQVERALAAHWFTLERNLRILKELQGQKEDSYMHFNSLVPWLVTVPSPVQVPYTPPPTNQNHELDPRFIFPVQVPPQNHQVNQSITIPSPTDQVYPSAVSQKAPTDLASIPPLPLPSQCSSRVYYREAHHAWLNWHRTMSPTSYMRPCSTKSELLSPVPHDPFMMRLDYLPFTAENEIIDQNMDACIDDSSSISSDSDDEDFIIVLVNNKL